MDGGSEGVEACRGWRQGLREGRETGKGLEGPGGMQGAV